MKTIPIIIFFALMLFGKLSSQQPYSHYFTYQTAWYWQGSAWDGVNGYGWWETSYIDGDTVINSLAYFKVYSVRIDTTYSWTGTDYGEYSGPTFSHLLREEDDKIYTWDETNNSEELSYDFNLQVGDPFFTEDAVCEILSINEIWFGGEWRKVFNQPDDYPVVEGIGATGQMCLFGIENGYILICFQRNDEWYSPNGEDCSEFPPPVIQFNGVGETINENEVSIYPNPSNDKMTVSFYDHTEKSIQLFDQTGRLISEYLSSDSELELNHDDIMLGVYFIHISDNQHASFHKLVFN